MSEVTLYVDEEGTVTFVYDDRVMEALGGLGLVDTVRVSHVEPSHLGGWMADMRPLGGPVLGPFGARGAALDAELAWLDSYLAINRVKLQPTLYAAAVKASKRFWSKVDKTGSCWVWRGYMWKSGALKYGAIRLGSKRDGTRRTEAAHHVAWLLTYGPLPPGAWVLHRCDNSLCMRPQHLFLGDAKANNADMLNKGRARPGGRVPLSTTVRREIYRLSTTTPVAALAKMYKRSKQRIYRIIADQRKQDGVVE